MTGSGRRGPAGLMLALALVAPSAAHPAPKYENCPGPHCTEYNLLCSEADNRCRLPVGKDGISRVPYWVHAQQPWMTERDVVGAVRAAARAWEMYTPRVRFVFRGTTTDPPTPRDGKMTVGFVPLVYPAGAAMTNQPGGEADVFLALERRWFWSPCHTRCDRVPQRNCSDAGACGVTTPEWAGTVSDATGFSEIQGIITHELGHVIGLGHPESRGLTMQVMPYEESTPGTVVREMSTPGLGDILGAKELYPWSCPKIKRGRSYPSAYRYVCPSIRVFSP